ncbi:MAG: GNAT family N-acetyltransferase [Verrucomicrobiota bacterium]
MIRPATIDDRGAIYAMADELAANGPITKEGFKSSFDQILKLPHMGLLVAEYDGILLGYVLASYYPCFYAVSNVAWTAELFVDSAHRRKGIGRALMGGIEKWAIENECTLNTLATRRAGSFYSAISYDESAGYYKRKLAGEQDVDLNT